MIPKTCPDEQKIKIPEHRRCRPPKRTLTVVPMPGAPTTRAIETVVEKARVIEREAVAEAKELQRQATEAAKVAEQAKAQTKRAREFKYMKLPPPPPRAAAPSKAAPTAPAASTAPTVRRRPAKPAPEPVAAPEPTEPEDELEAPAAGPSDDDRERLTFFLANEPDAKAAVVAFPEDPCTGQAYARFRTDAPALTRRNDWLTILRRCHAGEAKRGALGLGKLSRKEVVALKDRLLGGRQLTTRMPRHTDIDPWTTDVDPCDGMTYAKFRPGFTRKEAYWAASREDPETGGRRGPSHKKTNASMAVLKREAWRDKLHACATRVYLSRARVSKNPAIRQLAEDYVMSHRTSFNPDEFGDDFSGLGRTRPKGTPRCKDAPKKLTKSCSEEAFRKNMRHLACVAKKPQGQAKAIGMNVLATACHTTRRTKKSNKARSVKQIVAQGKRHATLKKKRKAKR